MTNTVIRIGVVCLARNTYDVASAKELYQQTLSRLNTYPEVEWVAVPELIIEVEEAQQACQYLMEQHLDGLVIITGTFHLGHLALLLKQALPVPTLLWAFKELPYNGGKIRLNSVCGMNLNASNLYKAGHDDVVCCVGEEIDASFLKAVRMMASIKNKRLGLIGYRADGFFNLGIDEMQLHQKTGILIDHYELNAVIDLEVSPEAVEGFLPLVKSFSCSDINETQAHQVACLCAKFETFLSQHDLAGLAIRCWPEFASLYGISPCAAMSILQSRGHLLACEGDLEGLLSMIICQSLGHHTPFLADLSQVDLEQNHALLWHCGVAPDTLWDQTSDKSLDSYFAAGRGVTVGFVLKPGRINLVRIDSARGKTRFFFQSGEAVPMEKLLTGTYAKVVFDQPVSDVLDVLTRTGVAHHLALVYEDDKKAFQTFARLMQYEWIES